MSSRRFLPRHAAISIAGNRESGIGNRDWELGLHAESRFPVPRSLQSRVRSPPVTQSPVPSP